jgi:hypothetical protein
VKGGAHHGNIPAAAVWSDNASLILSVSKLGYLRQEWRTLDPTYGLGTWWKLWQPERLVRCDLNPELSPDRPDGVDVRDLPWRANTFDAVAFDPPYKLNGTGSDPDVRYDVDEYGSIAERHELIFDGIDESLRVLKPEGILLVKCQDQNSSGRVQWQTRLFSDYAEWGDVEQPSARQRAVRRATSTTGQRAELVGAFLPLGSRAQPKGRTQKSERRNYSTLLVVRKAKAPRKAKR